jgi:hypothetical protein
LLVLVAVLLCGCVADGNHTRVGGQNHENQVQQMPLPPMPRTARASTGSSSDNVARAVNPPTGTPPLNSVTLAWSESPDQSVTGYRVYFGAASQQYTNSVTVGKVEQAVITNLVSGTTYYFAATAYDAAGVESDFSNEAVWLAPYVSNRVERLVLEVYSALDGPLIREHDLGSYTNTPTGSQMFLRLRQELIRLEKQ